MVILSRGVLNWVGFGSPVAHAAPAEGSLVRVASNSAVYYVGRDGKRYVFPNEATYFSWYPNFSSVQVVDDATLASMPIGRLIPVRPNIRTVRFDSDPKLYAVEPGGVLRWIPDEATFQRLGYRSDQVVRLPDVFRVAYSDGTQLTRPPSSAVVQVGSSGPIYFVSGNTRYAMTPPVAQQNRYFANHIRHVAQSSLESLVDGPAISGFDQAVAGRPDDVPSPAGGTTPPPSPTSTAPAAPTNFIATGGSQQVQLNWQRSSSNAVVNYVVYLAFSPITNVDAGGITIAGTPPASASSYNVPALAPGTRYYFAIRAAGPSGTFSSLATASTTTLDANAQVPPSPPTSFVATGGSQQVQLGWTPSATPGVTSYVVYRSTSFFNQVDAPGVVAVATTSAAATSYTSAGLASGTSYFFAIRARGSNGLYSAAATASAVTDSGSNPPSAPAPNPPTSFTATPSSQSVQLAWSPSNSAGVQSYQLYRSPSPISDPAAGGVTAIATVGASTLAYLDSGLSPNATYHYAARATNSSGLSSALATAQATTLQPPLDRILQLPEQPDNLVPGSLQRSMDLADLAVSLGINKFMVPTTYYQGLNDLSPSYSSGARCTNHDGRFCAPYHQFLSHLDTLRTPDGRPAQAILLTAKVTKAPMANDAQEEGAMQLRRMGVEHAAYNFLTRLPQTSGTLPPSGQGENRAFLTVSFGDAMERDRLLRLVASFAGTNPNVLVRWYPTSWNTAKVMDAGSQGSGTHTYDFPNPSLSANTWYLLIMNYSTTDAVDWSISSFQEVDPAAGSVRSIGATTYDWLGNAYLDLARQPRYALDSTVSRFVGNMNAVWNEFRSHPSLAGSMGNGDEPAAMYWMPEDTSRYANAGDELASFEKSVAAGQFSASQSHVLLFGDPRDPTQNGRSTGMRGVNMAGGGFGDMASRFSGSEPIDWVLWSNDHSASAISGFTSQGFGVYLMQQLGDPFMPGFQSYVAGASSLPSQEKARVRGWFYYTDPGAEGIGQTSQATLQQAIAVTPDHL